MKEKIIKKYSNIWYNYYSYNFKKMNEDEKLEAYLELLDQLNIRRAIEVDSKWISEYSQLSNKCYLLSSALVEEHEYLQKKIKELEDIIDELNKWK